MPNMRLDKYLRSQGLAARSELRQMIRKGLVLVNDQLVKDPGLHVDTDTDSVYVNGIPITYEQFVFYMLNKPKGVITATEDKNMKTVLDLLPENIRRREVFPVGRLDKDTEGLLIITNDGVLAHDLISPRKHVVKLYEAELDSFPGDIAIKKFEEGLVLEDGYRTLPAELNFISKTEPVIAQVGIYEGKYHQVKRMFKAVGATVIGLKRLRMGEVCLDKKLKPGEFRKLTPEEVRSFSWINGQYKN